MEYQLALPPGLGLDPEDFVTAWNTAPESCTVAAARLAPSTGAAYDPFLLAGAITLVSSVATGVLINVISEQIKHLLPQKGEHKQVQVQQLDQPDGRHLLIVTIEEE